MRQAGSLGRRGCEIIPTRQLSAEKDSSAIKGSKFAKTRLSQPLSPPKRLEVRLVSHRANDLSARYGIRLEFGR